MGGTGGVLWIIAVLSYNSYREDLLKQDLYSG